MARLKDWVMRYVFAGRASTAADADTNEVVVTDDGALKVELSGSNVTDAQALPVKVTKSTLWRLSDAEIASLKGSTVNAGQMAASGMVPVDGADTVIVSASTSGDDIPMKITVLWWEDPGWEVFLGAEVVADATTVNTAILGAASAKAPYFSVWVHNKSAAPITLGECRAYGKA